MEKEKDQAPQDYTLAVAGKSRRTFDTLFDEAAREAEVKKNTATGEKILEKRRREYEEQSLHLDALKNRLVTEGKDLDPEEVKKILVMQLVVGIPAIVSGLGIVIDSVSCQEVRKLKNGKTGAARLSTGRVLCDIASIISGLYGDPDKSGNVPDGEKGVLDVLGDETLGRMDFMIRQLFAVGGMVHMAGKHEDPRMFAGTVEDPKTGTKIDVDDLFDDKIMEQFQSEAAPAARVKEEKVFDDQEVLTDEESDEIKKSVQKVDIIDQMKGLKL